MYFKRVLPLVVLAFTISTFPDKSLFAQDGVLIDYQTTPPARSASAVMELRSTDQGFLAPRVVLTATNVAAPVSSPANGLMVYNTNATGSGTTDVQPGYYYWNGTGWTRLMSGNTQPLSGSGAATRVAFWDGVSSLSSDADLYWDNTAKRLGIGITSPGQLLDVDGVSRFRNTMNFGVTDNEGLISWTSNMGNGEAGLVIRGQTSRGILLGANNGSHMMVDIAGNVGIGTTSGPGQKLDVVGGSIRTDNQLMSTIATGTSPLQVSSTTLNANLNSDLLDGWHAEELQFQQSNRNFPNGTLIQTDINYAVTSGEPWLLEIEGNSYGNLVPLDLKVQGYIYYDSLINVGGISNGHNITGLSAFNYNGNLCFWFPYQAYWQGYSIYVNDSYAGIKHNRLVSITHQAKPGGITKEVQLTPKIRQSWHSGNFNPSNYTPSSGSNNYIQNQTGTNQAAGFRVNGNGLFNGGSVGIGDVNPNSPLTIKAPGTGDQELYQTWRYQPNSDVYTLKLKQTVTSGVVRYTFDMINNSTAYNDVLTFDRGKVGIGTTDPSTLLNIDLGAGGSNSTAALKIGGLSNYPSLELGIKGNYDGVIRTYGNNLHLYAGHWRTSGTAATENHNMSFYTSETGSTNWETPKMFIDHNGEVGIGTSSPGSKLDVTEVAGNFPVLRVNHDANSGETGIRFRTRSSGGSSAHADISWTATGSETGNLVFRVPYTDERMRIQSNGNVGIGSTAPVTKLEIEGGSANWNETTPGTSVGTIHLDPENTAAHYGSAITWGASDTGGGDNAHAGIYVRSDGSYGTKMYFGTTDSYASGSKTRMFIDNNGEVGINNTNPTQQLDVDGQVRIRGGSPAADKVLTSTDANGNATWQTPTSHTSASADANGTGWKRIAHIDGSAGRGHGKVTVYTTGGSYAPRMTTINWNHDYSADAGITLTSESGTSNYWSDVRITDDGTNSYIEVYFTTDVNSLSLLSDNYGYRPAVLYSGNLPSGGGNVRATSKVGHFNAGENTLIADFNDRVGVGTGTPSQKLHVAGGTEIEAAAIEGNSATRIYRNLVSESWGGGQTGALVIQTNVPQDEHTMTQTWINWKRRYSTGSTNNQIIASGYWSSESNGGFQGLGYTTQGGEILRVRFMRNSSTGNVAIVIGETNTSWSYPNVSVTKMSAHYGLSSDSYADGWTASFSTTLSGLINSNDVPNVTTAQSPNCRICLYYCDNNCGSTTHSSIRKRCVAMVSGSISPRLDLLGDVDDNDDMWIGFECD